MPLKTVMIPSEARMEDKRLNKLKDNEWLPQPMNGGIYVCGSAGAGKSSWLYSFYNEWCPMYFDEVVVFCATRDSAETWNKLKQRNVVVLHKYSDQILDNYLKDLEEEQLQRKEDGKFPLRVSIIFDDMAGAKITNNSKPTALDRLALNCRHYNVLYIISTQRFRIISNTLRQNVMYVVLYRMAKPDLKRVAEEFSDPLSPDDFLEMATKITSMKHKYIFIDLRAPPEKRFRYEMNQII
jgi:hypothetical protein